jgi:hypothetical protein
MSKEKTQHLGSKTPSKKISKSKKTNLEFVCFFSNLRNNALSTQIRCLDRFAPEKKKTESGHFVPTITSS